MGSKSRLYRIWHDMKTRCTNPNYDKYEYYGGKGISICDEWMNSYNSFSEWAFANGYTDQLTLDRIDVDGNYSPDNCRWATRKEQANNRSNNVYLEYNGKRQTIQQWSDETGLSHDCIKQRISAGWSVERTLTEPLNDTHTEINITFNGETKRLYEWAEYLGIKYKTLHNRIFMRKWTIEKALTTPVGY